MRIPRPFQFLLLIVGASGLIAVIVELSFVVVATTHGSTPAKVIHVDAGPYPLTVNLYKDPANAGYALPFSIAPQEPVHGTLTFDVSSLPGYHVDATPVRASISTDPNVPNGIQGTAEITVQGEWTLQVDVDGPQGQGVAYVPITANAPPAIPVWLGWLIGLTPLYGLLVFLLMQRGHKTKGRPEKREQVLAAQ